MSSTEFQHYELLRKYLSTHTVNRLSTQRASAREKLTKLTKQQFSELSTDVYDELMRRQSDALLPFLQVRDDFHPKRNQARQKLATLPASRFKDLASDVYYEVERRSTNLINQYLLKYPDDGTSNAGFDPPSSPTVTSTDQSNFGSLDHLIADLGNMMGSPTKSSHSDPVLPSNTGNNPDTLEKSRSKDTDSLIKELRDKNLSLEDECNASRANVLELNDKVSSLQDKISDLESSLDKASKNLEKVTQDYSCLNEDYLNQQNIANDIRSEASNLLEEIKSLSRRNDDLLAENAKLVEDNKRLDKENKDLVAENKDLKNREMDPTAHYINSSDYEDGVIDEKVVASYETAVAQLLKAAKTDTPTSVLIAMKAIVIACKSITEDTEAFENSPQNRLSDNEMDQLSSIKVRLSNALTTLMTNAKNHATSFGNSPQSVLESSATTLTATIVDLVELVKLKTQETKREIQDIDELKLYLEQQTDLIVQAIQTLLYSMKQSETFGSEFIETVSNITKTVDKVVIVSHETLASSAIYSRANLVLSELKKSSIDLGELGNSMVNPSSESSRKPSKQKLASCSYEIAKFVKELISLIE